MNPHRICNLCLVKCDNYRALEENMKTVLGILLPAIEFTVIQEPVMCQNCEKVLWKCFAFKEKCLNSYDYLVSLVNKDTVKLDLKNLYMGNSATGTGVLGDQDICGFCMGLVKKCHVVSLDVEEGRAILEKMIGQCLPELDLSIIKNPIICADCHRSLEDCFRFVTNIVIVEEKFKKYCESYDINKKGRVKLNSLLHSIMKTVEASDIDGDTVDIFNAENQSCVKIENPEASEFGSIGDLIKIERMSCDDSGYVKVVGNKIESVSDCAEDNMRGIIKSEKAFCEEHETKPEDGNFIETGDQKFIFKEEIEIKTDEYDFNSLEENVVINKVPSEVIIKCQYCSFHTRWKCSLKMHMVKHMDSSDVTMFNCETCSYRTKNKNQLKRHLITHKASSKLTMFKCESCPFQAQLKRTLQKHMLEHIDPSDVTMFTCDICSFQTKYRYSFNQHLITHKAPSDVTMFKCDSCSFQTRRKDKLKDHTLKHMDPSEVTMFKCDSCPFQTKRKTTLKSHMMKHMDPSEVKMFTCDTCSYHTKYKYALKQHCKIHKAASELTMFKCDSCPYQTIWKYSLKMHIMVTHMNPSEVTVFTCDSCSFQTRRKEKLKSHVLKHMDASEVTMFPCDICSYRTKYKDKLKQHSDIHKESSEISMFECDSCPFKTRWKSTLKNHMLKHMDPSDIALFKCDSCPFQTRWKDYLKSHALKHVDPSEVAMFTCDVCSYQTKYKKELKRHRLRHVQK